jgi:hypothetical protein
MATQHAEPVYLNGNGNGIDYANTAPDERLYIKLLQLKDQVLAGSHPRFKITPAQAALLRARAEPDAFAPSALRNSDPDHVSLGDTHRDADASFQPTASSIGLATSSSFVEPAHPASSSPHLFPTSTPQHRPRLQAPSAVIDPVLLGKSPILLQAEAEIRHQRELAAQRDNQRQIDSDAQRQNEFAIKRHNLEKIISQQVDAAASEASAPVVTSFFEKAQEIVAIVSGVASPLPPTQSPSHASFDENSYYSSKADSWSTERTPLQGDQNDSDAMSVSDEEEEDLYEPPSQVSAPSGPSPATVPVQHSASLTGVYEPSASQQDWEPQWDDEEDEDEDYEPPAPYIFGDHPQNSSFMPSTQNVLPTPHHSNHFSQAANNARGHHGAPTIIENRIRSPVSIAVNHIQSPAAPQPSRISPLALGLGKVIQPALPQFNGQQRPPSGATGLPGGRRDEQHSTAGMDRNGGKNTRRPSPGTRRAAKLKRKAEAAAAAAAEAAKKRKRAASPDGRDKRKNKKGKRRAMSPHAGSRSPETYIKLEPVSPPPDLGYAEYAPTRRTSGNYRNAQDVELMSPRIARPSSAYRGSDYSSSPRGYRYTGEDVERVPQQLPAAYRQRDTQDLRRVASLHYARRPMSPPTREYGAYTPAAESRTFVPSPYEVVERPQLRHSAYPEAAPRPMPHYTRPGRTPSPTRFADPYGRTHSPALMPPPPPRQVLVDEFGNRYVPEQPAEYRVVSQPSRMDVDPFYHRATTREPTLRPVRVADVYEDIPYQGMPPPPRSRAFTQLPEDIAGSHSHRERAYSVRPQVVSPRAAPARGYSGHEASLDRRPPPPRFEEAPPPREFVPRPYSVRPEPPRQEVPDYVARSGSVQPGGGYLRRDMPPPPMPTTHGREPMAPGDGYRYTPGRGEHRGRYADAQNGGEATDEVARTPYGDGRRVVTYEY